MAKVIAIGPPVNESEREAIAYLRDHLPNTFTVIHNFELKQGHEIYEIDIALLGPHCVHVVDVKGTRGHVDVHRGKWYPERRAPYQSPLAILRRHAKALETLDSELARELEGIPFSSSATVNLAYRRGDIGHPLDGYGFVVPHAERRKTTACTFSSVKYAGRAPEDLALLRCFTGARCNPACSITG